MAARPLEDRFWEKVDRRGPDECWPWIAKSVSGGGYGRIGIGPKGAQKILVATHVSWEIAHDGQPVPDGLWVLHKCDNPPCVNPAHLFLGTAADNNRDRDAKGRTNHQGPRGERSWTAKLTEDDVREIRLGFKDGVSNLALARRFGVDDSQISRIRTGKLWKCVVALAVAVQLSGCLVSRAEYASFVKASRSFYNEAAPIVTTSVASDPNLAPQSVKNRLGFVEDYRLALEAAEARAKGLSQ